MFSVIFVLMWLVVPKLIGIFGDTAQLPTATRLLVASSEFVQSYWYLFIIMPFVVFSVIMSWRKTERGLYITDHILLKIPGV